MQKIINHKDKIINEAAKETFPSSDPPAWTLGTDAETLAAMNKSDIVHILNDEHDLIRSALKRIDDLIRDIHAGKRANTEILKSLCSFFTDFVVPIHHEKEELLFKALHEGKNHPSDYLLNDLHHEHESGKILIKQLENVIIHSQTKKNDVDMLHILKDIKNLHINHLAKEEGYVFPLVTCILDKEKQKELGTQFLKIDTKLRFKLEEKFATLLNQAKV